MSGPRKRERSSPRGARGKSRAERDAAVLSAGPDASLLRRWTPLLVAAVVAFGYLHTLSYSYHFDDVTSIRDNPALDRPADLRSLWEFRPSRFVLYLSFAWNAAVTGRDPAGMRFVNLVIHLLNALLVGWIASELYRRLAGDRATRPAPRAAPELVGIIAALLFAAHPLATQAVTYVFQRAASLTALFELTAVALYLRARRGGGPWLWAGSWVAAIVASFTKEIAVILPVAIAVIEIALRRAGERPARLACLAPYLAVVPIVNWTSHLYNVEERRALEGFTESAQISHAGYLMTQLVVVPRYLGLWVWPSGQNLDHDVAVRHGLDGPALVGILILVALSAGAFLIRRRAPLVTLGWTWFLVCLIPESSVVPIRDVMFEHRAYIPMAGLSWGAGALLAEWAAPGRVRYLAPVALVLALVAVTHVRNRVWRDEASLWSDVTRKSPQRARGFNNLAMALERTDPARAEQAYRWAIATDPAYVYGRVNLSRFYSMRGRDGDALRLLHEADSLAPGQVEILNNMGNAWWGLGDTARAAESFERAIAANPRAIEPARNLARMRGAPGLP